MELIDDQGWDDEITSSSSRGYKALRKELISKGLLAYYKGNTYTYLSSSNAWSVLISAEAQRQICDIVGGENASVSYLAASLPYINYLEKHAIRTGSIPVSICIGTRRLRISKEKSTLELSECSDIASIDQTIDSRVSSFCVMPCSVKQIPTSWSPKGAERILKYIRVLFLDQVELQSIQWILGLAALDPSATSKFLLLYGPGGTGKSTLISLIEDIFNGCCGTISSSVLTSKSSDIKPDTARTIASNRIITAGDIDLESSKFNLHTIKEITGHDSVSVPPIKVRTRCSLVAASNDLPHPRTQPTWCSAAISRRMLVIPMDVKTSLIPKLERPDSTEDSLDFLLSCVNIHLNYPSSPPISMRSLMYTILGVGFSEIEHDIKFDKECEIQELFDANTSIEIYFGLEVHTLGELASLVSPTAIVEHASIYFIKNIRLLRDINNTNDV